MKKKKYVYLLYFNWMRYDLIQEIETDKYLAEGRMHRYNRGGITNDMNADTSTMIGSVIVLVCMSH